MQGTGRVAHLIEQILTTKRSRTLVNATSKSSKLLSFDSTDAQDDEAVAATGILDLMVNPKYVGKSEASFQCLGDFDIKERNYRGSRALGKGLDRHVIC